MICGFCGAVSYMNLYWASFILRLRLFWCHHLIVHVMKTFYGICSPCHELQVFRVSIIMAGLRRVCDMPISLPTVQAQQLLSRRSASVCKKVAVLPERCAALPCRCVFFFNFKCRRKEWGKQKKELRFERERGRNGDREELIVFSVLTDFSLNAY
jgi:hypothetical protein